MNGHNYSDLLLRKEDKRSYIRDSETWLQCEVPMCIIGYVTASRKRSHEKVMREIKNQEKKPKSQSEKPNRKVAAHTGCRSRGRGSDGKMPVETKLNVSYAYRANAPRHTTTPKRHVYLKRTLKPFYPDYPDKSPEN